MKAFDVSFEARFKVEAETEAEAEEKAIQIAKNDFDDTFLIDVDELECCRICGCTEEEACDGGCDWLPTSDGTLVCDSAPCAEAYAKEGNVATSH